MTPEKEVKWPSEAAKATKFHRQNDSEEKKEYPDKFVYELTYREETKRLYLLNDGYGETDWSMDPADILAVNLDISFAENVEKESSSTKTKDASKEEFSTVGEIATNHTAVACLNIYAYPKRTILPWNRSCGKKNGDSSKSTYGNRQACHLQLQLAPCEDFARIREIVKAIQSLASLEIINTANPKKYLVIVNPHSGSANAMKTYTKLVEPMLHQQCGIELELLVTTHSGHATEHCSKLDTKQYDAIIAMGGDGILHEILQKFPLPTHLKFGIIGCGTCNGLAKTLLHWSNESYNILESIFLIGKGKSAPIDTSLYQTRTKKYTSFLTYSYGLVADIDLESEVLRFIGDARILVYAVWKIMTFNIYLGRLSYLPANANVNDNVPKSLEEPLPDKDWITVEDQFITIWASHVTHASYDLHNSPQSKIDNGVFEIMLLKYPISRMKLIQVFLDFETGKHVRHKDVISTISCVAYRWEPAPPRQSYNNIDGEVVEPGPIQATIQPQSLKMFVNPTS